MCICEFASLVFEAFSTKYQISRSWAQGAVGVTFYAVKSLLQHIVSHTDTELGTRDSPSVTKPLKSLKL